MDIVYVVRPGDRNEELRYSLRSLQNLPHGRVWIAGHIPNWVSNVGAIAVKPDPNKYRSAEANLRAACEHPAVSDPFLLFNDDFFVMQPMQRIPLLHRGPLVELINLYLRKYSKTSIYTRGMQQVEQLLYSMDRMAPVSYEMHAPMPVRKKQMLEVLSMRGDINCFHLRTLYGNLHYRVRGRLSEDVKIYKNTDDRRWVGMPLLSTSDIAFRYQRVGKYIRDTFPSPSEYERVHSRAA